jgi:CHASE2 domain-containing sensor protein
MTKNQSNNIQTKNQAEKVILEIVRNQSSKPTANQLLEHLCQEKTAILQLQPIRNPGSIERKAAAEPALR